MNEDFSHAKIQLYQIQRQKRMDDVQELSVTSTRSLSKDLT